MICPGPSQPAPRAACAHEIVQTIPVRRRGDSQQRADHLDLRVRRTSLPWRLGRSDRRLRVLVAPRLGHAL